MVLGSGSTARVARRLGVRVSSGRLAVRLISLPGVLILSSLSFAAPCWTGPAQPSALKTVECRDWPGWQNEDDVRCGYLTVPEDHADPAGRKIKLAFAVFKGKAGSDPTVATLILTGGPGGRALASPSLGANHRLRDLSDLVVVEQRGVGLSSAVQDSGEQVIELMARDLSSAEEIALTREAMTAKASEIRAAGIGLEHYNSTQNASDFGALMAALGYDGYNLYGLSYGTKLAMTIMKYFPSRVRAAILEGPAVLDGTALESRFPDLLRALNLLFDRCAREATCRAAHVDLKADMMRAIESLEKNPITVELLDRAFTINPQDLLFLIRYLLYADTALDTVPRLVQAVNGRNLDTVQRLAAAPARILRGANVSVFYSFNLYEEYSPETPGRVADFIQGQAEFAHGLAWFQAFIPALEVWHRGRVTAAEARLENIEAPALVITNEFDPVTPPHNTILFEQALINEQVLRLDRFGHGAGGACIGRIRTSFLRDPGLPVGLTCLKAR